MFLWLTFICAVLIHTSGQSVSRANQQILAHKTEPAGIRLNLFTVGGAFTEVNRQHLATQVLPAVTEFYSKAFRVLPLVSPLKPSVNKCNSVSVPEVHQRQGLESDVIVYVYADESLDIATHGKSCEQEGGKFKRPIVGTIGIRTEEFFYLSNSIQVLSVIREVAHVLAFDMKLFQDFVKSDGSRYSNTEYLIGINYPKRGKTVKAVAFPKMLIRARGIFNCRIEGLELEDYYESLQGTSFPTFWESRVMTHDILSSRISGESIFSEISMALFEDSGWYYPNYEYSQAIRWGKNEGCKWFEEKCIFKGNVNLPGFCNEATTEPQCDFFSTGYGQCSLAQSQNIPPHEQYFEDKTLGGLDIADYCPIVLASPATTCSSISHTNSDSGESRGSKSRCLRNTLMVNGKKDVDDLSAGCYSVIECQEKTVTLRVGNSVVDCPFGQQITVNGFSGYLVCPKGDSFCRDTPCPNMCGGRGTCLGSSCVCNSGWSGPDCSLNCVENCKACKDYSNCEACVEGFFLSRNKCEKCDKNCRSCDGAAGYCTGCSTGQLVGNKCINSCLPYCASCDSPCSKCSSGYFLKNQNCEPCDKSCVECSQTAIYCISCKAGTRLQGSACVPDCTIGCVNCDFPCRACLDGYMLSGNTCKLCDNVCATCSESTSKCTSCMSGYLLINSTCKQNCKANCLSCDNPCTVCEDGYFKSVGECSPCSFNCLTCGLSNSICTSCKTGYLLKGSTCIQSCLSGCMSCYFPCTKCSEDYYLQDGTCHRCKPSCKTCAGEDYCFSCNLPYGLLNNDCVKACSDHCLSCDSPCSKCDSLSYLWHGSCLLCDPSCKSCTGSGNRKCDECSEGYSMVQGECRKGCQEFCISCDEPCTKCELGSFQFGKGCSKCPEGCFACTSMEKCSSCVYGYGYIDDTCRKLCPDFCVSCDTPCTKCQKGYFPSGDNCKKCVDPCLTCQSSDICLTCKPGYDLSNNKCKLGCIENCSNCNHPCQSCVSGFTLKDGLCVACPLGCQTCSSDLLKCYSCSKTFYYQDNQCVKLCPENCKSCDDTCTECEIGYLLVGESCEICQHPCSSCLNHLDYCTSCFSGYALDDYKCTPTCLEHCKTCHDPCELCEDGFLPFQGLCEPCSTSCRTCSNAPDNCTTCPPWKKLIKGKCVEFCIDNCLDCSYPCRACKDGYQLKDNECKVCENFLSSKDVSVEFIRDYTGLIFTFEKPVANPLNSCNYYFVDNTIAMIGAGALCNWDKAEKLIMVFGEDPDYNIRTVVMKPVVGLGINCLSVAKEIAVQINLSYLPKPVVSISAPLEFSLACGNGVLTIQGVTQETTYKFSFETNPKIESLEAYLSGLEGKVLVVPESLLAATKLNVTFSATNVLGTSSQYTRFVDINDKKKLSVSIDAGSRLKIMTSQSYLIHGLIQQTSCIDLNSLQFSWKYIEVNSIASSEAYKIVKNPQLPHLLHIKSGSLEAGRSYLFRFEVHNNDQLAFADIQIDMYESSLVAIIDRSRSSIPHSGTLELSAKLSYDPDDSNAVLQYEWSCTQGLSGCFDSQNKTLMKNEHSPVLRLSAFRMNKGQEYLFSVKVSRGHRISTDSVLLNATDSDGYIKILSPVNTISTNKDFSVYPEFSTAGADCSFNWIQAYGPAVQVRSKSSDPFLLIDKDELVQESKYTYRLEMDCENKASYSEVSWFTNAGPICTGLVTVIDAKSVTVVTNCSDGDLADFPLSYIYGIVKDTRFIPLKVMHSPSVTLNLNAGIWTVYVEVCDSLQACQRLTKLVEISGRALEASEHLYQHQKKYPDSVPLAILNNAATFNTENFKEAFDDLVSYIKAQEIDLVHLKMTIECLEILTFSNKSHFMWHYQSEIADFLIHIASQLESIDQEGMQYAVELFSEHRIKDYRQVSKLLCEFSSKWTRNAPPGSVMRIGEAIELVRHRFSGTDSSKTYTFKSSSVAEMNLQSDPAKLYDLVLISFPAQQSSVIDITYYLVGSYAEYTMKLLETNKEVEQDLDTPFFIDFKIDQPGNYECQQLKGSRWVNEGCSISYQFSASITVKTWHVNSYRLVKTHNSTLGLAALITEILMIAACLVTVTMFCITDKNRNNYIQAALVSEPMDSPRSVDNMPGEEDPMKRESVQSAAAMRGEVSLQSYPKIMYHPWFNVGISQGGERRAASMLHMFAVLFAEFLAVGLLFNPQFGHVFDENDRFLGFSEKQIVFGAAGVGLTQLVSVLFTCLNQVNDLTITKGYLGMGIGVLIVTVTAGCSLILTNSYPAKYSLWWTISFLVVAWVDLAIFQSIHWLISYKTTGTNLHKSNESRNMRVFTTET